MAEVELSDVATSEPRESGSGVVLLGGTVLLNMEDYNPDLKGSEAIAKWEEMRRADPEIAAGTARLTWPLVAAKWMFQPADDTDEEKDIAKFCGKWIFGEGRLDRFVMRRQDVLRHALLMVPEGVSAFEIVWGTDDEGHQVYAQLAPIMAKTIFEFHFDDQGQLDFMRQRAWTAKAGYRNVDIPAEKLALFTFGREGDNLFGWPLLRQVYKPWYFKDKLLRTDAIRHERHGVGFTVITVPKGAKAEVRERAAKVGREARVHERQYAVLEAGQTIEIIYPTGQGTNIVESIKYLDSQIAQVLFSEFMHLGASESGSRAVSKSKIDFMLAALQGVADHVAETINAQLVIPLVARNWGKREKWPRLVCEDLSKMSGPEQIEMLAKIMNVQVSGITNGPEIERYLREILQLPPMPPWLEKMMEEAQRVRAERAANPPAPPPAVPAPGNGTSPDKQAPPTDGEAASSKPAAQAKPPAAMLADMPAALSRDLLSHERYCAFADMKAYLQNEPKRVWLAVVAPYRRKAIDTLAGSAASATSAELKAGRIWSGIAFQARLASDLKPAFLKVYLKGRQAVVDELARQKAGTPVAEPVRFQEDAGTDIQPTAAQKIEIARLAGLFATAMLGMLRTEAIKATGMAGWSDLSADDKRMAVVDDLLGLSEAVQIAQLAGRLTQAFTVGRNEQAMDTRTEWDKTYYSAIMDENTCEACALLDGEEHDPEDPAYQTPNPNCAGAPAGNCRCETVYVRVNQQEAA